MFKKFRESDYKFEEIKWLLNENAEAIECTLIKCMQHTQLLTYNGQVTDSLVKEIVCNKTSNKSGAFEAISTSADGSCLYNAVSISLFGNESYGKKLRIACIHVAFKNINFFRQICSDYNECSANDDWLSKFSRRIASFQSTDRIDMEVLSLVINRPIAMYNIDCQNELTRSVYPKTKSLSDACESRLNETPIYICWYKKRFTALVLTSVYFSFEKIDPETNQFSRRIFD